MAQAASIKFAIGEYNSAQSYSKEWRRATEADWKDRAFQAQLVKAHQEGGGWPLLEDPLECNRALCVTEGYVQIDGALVIEVGHTHPPQELRGVYPAMNLNTKVAWTTTLPALGNNWTVAQALTYSNPPCLFVHESYNPAPGGGSRRSRRHKWSKRARKQKKKGTKKH